MCNINNFQKTIVMPVTVNDKKWCGKSYSHRWINASNWLPSRNVAKYPYRDYVPLLFHNNSTQLVAMQDFN